MTTLAIFEIVSLALVVLLIVWIVKRIKRNSINQKMSKGEE